MHRQLVQQFAVFVFIQAACLSIAGNEWKVLASDPMLEPGGAATKPNVLILLTDDQRAGTLNALGCDDVHTPNLDTLVRRGFSMNSAYCLGANMGAVCRPSRNMVLSGRTYFRWASRGENNAPPLPNTLPATFNAAGYETYHHGKRGNTAELIHQQFNHSHYLDDFNDRWAMKAGEKVVDDAISFLTTRQSDSPWLVYLAFAMPHDPRAASPEALSRYEGQEISLPPNVATHHPFDNGSVLGRDEWTALWPRSEKILRDQWRDYYACISTLDTNIGRLFKHLEDTSQLDNTIIVFTSDHGLAMGSHGLMGKQSVYEDGYKAPLVIAGPGIPKGESNAPVYLMDIFPSLCDMSGVSIPADLDGRSFAATVTEGASGPREAVMLSYTNSQRAIRNGDWKLICYPQINRHQLFNLENDPYEMVDLSEVAEFQELIGGLKNRLRALQVEAGDRLPLESPAPRDESYPVPESRIAGDELKRASELYGEALQVTEFFKLDSDQPSVKPFAIVCEPDSRITAIAIGTSGSASGPANGLRVDLITDGKGDRTRRSILAGDVNARWMPLLDQIKKNNPPTRFSGTLSNVGLASLKVTMLNGDFIPEYGAPADCESFETQLESAAHFDKLVGFYGTAAEADGQLVIVELGALWIAK